MNKCEYCGRFFYVGAADTCKGCGAPVALDVLPFAYDGRFISKQDLAYMGQPNRIIPVNIDPMEAQRRFNRFETKLSDMLCAIGGAGSSLV